MATLALPHVETQRPRAIAPAWHTVALVALFLVIATGGAQFQHRAHEHPAIASRHSGVLPLYASLIVMEWGMLYYVWKGGLRRTGTSLRELIGGRWGSRRAFLTDAALAAGLWGAWMLFVFGWQRWMSPDTAASVESMLPRSILEGVLWILLSVSAGICEEAVFRGYFQVQFHAFTGSRWLAVILQALVFGIGHGYQGVTACLKIALYGAMFGALAVWRRSLRPGMMAHAWTDIASGLMFR